MKLDGVELGRLVEILFRVEHCGLNVGGVEKVKVDDDDFPLLFLSKLYTPGLAIAYASCVGHAL